ncbi:MAG: hypothetical protein JWP89_2477 [Schlesneria sp.]|nr:hypothetical protein [Schlesneria sp.]
MLVAMLETTLAIAATNDSASFERIRIMLGKKVNAKRFCMSLAFVTAVACSNSAFAQNSGWYFPVMPWQTYYSAPSYSSAPAGSWGSCANGSCGVRQAPIQRMPANSQPTYVQPNYGTARPTFQPAPSPSQPVASQPPMTQTRTWQPSANRESPFYEYREAPTRQPVPATQPRRQQLPAQTPVARNQNDNSPFYP